MTPYYEQSGVTIYCGDCREILPQLTERFDACITDPPYGLEFMGKQWDHGVPNADTWRTVLASMKPGAHLLSFGGTRTHHRLMCAIEDAGFEIRDCLMWLYGSGFPKSLDISKAIDGQSGAKREVIGTYKTPAGRDYTTEKCGKKPRFDLLMGITATPVEPRQRTAPATAESYVWDGYGTALKPSYEPVILAMKPCDGTFAENALKHGVAGLNIDGSRIGVELRTILPASTVRVQTFGRPEHSGSGWREDAVSHEVNGRWPANLILDEESAAALDAMSGELSVTGLRTRSSQAATVDGTNWLLNNHKSTEYPGDFGGASRFFYTAKSSSDERGTGNNHPTVKPLDLMRYLCRLLCPPTGGILLDPFTGSGSTILAGRRFFQRVVAIEINEKYCEIAAKRLAQDVFEFV